MEIQTPKEVSKLLKKSTRWVYGNGDALGGVKISGSRIFTAFFLFGLFSFLVF
jgi:hypothetical protein